MKKRSTKIRQARQATAARKRLSFDFQRHDPPPAQRHDPRVGQPWVPLVHNQKPSAKPAH
jgi:hypothetical protein